MDTLQPYMNAQEINAERNRRWVSLTVGISLTIAGAVVALIGLNLGDSIPAQFTQQVGFAFFLAGIIDLLLTQAIDALRNNATRRDREILEKLSAIRSAAEDIDKSSKIIDEASKQVNQEARRVRFELEFQQRMSMLEYQVESIRMKLDPVYREERMQHTIETMDREIEESNKRFLEMVQASSVLRQIEEERRQAADASNAPENP